MIYLRLPCTLLAHLCRNNSTTFNKHKYLAPKAQLSKQLLFEGGSGKYKCSLCTKRNKINMCNKRFHPMRLEFL